VAKKWRAKKGEKRKWQEWEEVGESNREDEGRF
jgi:hypothetical protein